MTTLEAPAIPEVELLDGWTAKAGTGGVTITGHKTVFVAHPPTRRREPWEWKAILRHYRIAFKDASC